MNNMLKSLLVAALAVSATHVSAYTNRNYLSSPRAQAVTQNLDSAVVRDLIANKGHDRFGGNFVASVNYSESNDAVALGKYFGVKDKATFDVLAHGAATVADNVDGTYFIYGVDAAGAPVNANAKATVTLAPKTTTIAGEIAYVQCLGKILDGLHMSIQLPFERVETSMNMTVAGNDKDDVNKFLTGAYDTDQAKLAKAVFGSKQSANGIADIKATLGYDFIRNDDWTAGLNIGLTIPTGNTPEGKFVFEPVYGNGGHWELGVGGRVEGRLWHDGDQSLKLQLAADYRYGFQAKETRTVSGKDNWSQYYLGGQPGKLVNTVAPAANGFTQPVNVTPNSSIRGNLGLAYGNGGFTFGVAYQPAWRQAETVANDLTIPTDAAPITATFATNAVVRANAANFTATTVNGPAPIFAAGQAPAAALVANDLAVGGANNANQAAALAAIRLDTATTKADFDMNSATRPAQLSHRLGADMGYSFKDMEYPVSVGVNGHYELAGDNASVTNWGVGLKAGIGF